MNRQQRQLFSLLVVFALTLCSPDLSRAVISQHLDYGCSICHYWHGGSPGTALLAAMDTQSLCLSCHGEGSAVATVVTVHNPLALSASDQGYITCRECHDAHEYVGTPNKRMIGYEYDPETNLSPASPPAIRVENTTTSLASPVYRTVTFENDSTDATPDFNVDGTFPGPGICQVCHDPNHNVGQDCTACHQHDNGFLTACTDCHDGTGAAGTAEAVSVDSPHADTATGYTCVDCHSGHGAGDVEVPNNPTVGINYSSNGESGISLSDPVGTATTEAQICWNCHAQGAVNADWRTGGDYPSYSISARDWTAASFDGPGVIPDRAVVSIHSANDVDVESPAPTTAGIGVNATVRSSSVGNNWNNSNGSVNHSGLMENVSSIRCSYCHDVHDLNAASNDTTSGKPYLRGSWLSNPYALERPPQSGDDWAGNTFGQGENFPRLYSNINAVGGYQIDQNNGFPTSGETLASTSGLCLLCHGSTTDSLDYYSNSSSATRLWLAAKNGHANSTIGGAGPGSGNNLFNANHSGPPYAMATQNGVGVYNFGKANSEYMKKNGFYAPWRNEPQAGKGNSSPPPKNTGWYGGTIGSNTRGSEYSNWYGGVVAKMAGETRAHSFSCSKCHSPHASGLPALLITNCLDRSIATWSGSVSSTTVGPGETSGVASSVQNNCHRKEGTYTSGWNRMAPGQ